MTPERVRWACPPSLTDLAHQGLITLARMTALSQLDWGKKARSTRRVVVWLMRSSKGGLDYDRLMHMDSSEMTGLIEEMNWVLTKESGKK